MTDIHIRPYRLSDLPQIERLVVDTIHAINRRDYTQEQAEVWADLAKKNLIARPLEKNHTYVAEINGQIVGFGEITSEGYLDRLYVHKDFQGRGIASKLLEVLESKVLHVREIETDASITAKPFFLAKGYLVKEKQVKDIKGISLVNFRMYKKL